MLTCTLIGLLLASPQAALKSSGDPYRAIIDRAVDRALSGASAKAADDTTFLRRVYVDIIGVAPRPESVEALLGSSRPDKRAAVIDDLLGRANAASHFGEIWSSTLLGGLEITKERRINRTLFARWLAEGWDKDEPWDRVARSMITASGSPDQVAPVNFLLAHMSPEELIGDIARVFMGVSIQCAECHDHPDENITRKDFYGMLAFFGRTQLRVEKLTMIPDEAKKNMSPSMEERVERQLENAKRRGNDTPYARPVISDRSWGEIRMPDEGELIRPRFITGEKPPRGSGQEQRAQLADLVTYKESGYFARAFVNRTWAHYMGRPLAGSLDDLGLERCAASGAHEKTPALDLLCELSRAFAAQGCRPRGLVRGILLSRAYQMSTNQGERPTQAVEALSVRQMKPLLPEELYETILEVTGADETLARGDPLRQSRLKERALFGLAQLYGDVEGRPGGAPIATVPLSLTLMNGDALNKAISPFPGGTVDRLFRDIEDNDQRIRQLFLVVLSRPPRIQEAQYFAEFLEGTQGRPRMQRQAYSDMLWALINSTEFLYNH
jgi:hypothetical protein